MAKKITISLSILICLGIILLRVGDNPPPVLTSPSPTPEPTVTPHPLNTILVTRQRLFRHFEHRYNFTTWTEQAYEDGTQHVIGKTPSNRQQMNLYTSRGEPENLSQIYFSFRYNDQTFSRERERESGIGVMLDMVRLAFPQRATGEDWVKAGLASGDARTVIDGVSVYLRRSKEIGLGDSIVTLVIIEEK